VHNLEVSRVERINIGTFVSCVPRKRHDTRTFNNSPSGKHNGIFLISWLYPRRAQNTIPRLIRTMLMLLTCISSWVLILNTPFITTLPCQCIILFSLSISFQPTNSFPNEGYEEVRDAERQNSCVCRCRFKLCTVNSATKRWQRRGVGAV